MYTAAAGMAAQQQRLAALSNDLANVNTTGYKRTRVAFRDLVYTPAGPGTSPGVQEGSGAAATSVGRGAAQGALKRTDRRLDVAVDGPGFIRARGEGGEVLTRDGALRLDATGRLLTGSGHFTGVTVPAGTAESAVTIARDGTVTDGTRVIGRLDLVNVRSTDGLRANGDNTFSATAASGPATAGDVRVEQGALEASNVDVADAMADMIEAQRSFELTSRAIRMQDQLLEIANGVKR
ncbi:MAG TPA: flagellar hook-basal body protein [Solirubrobacteraceae bacterium]|jgi:flagellar basal-body rod protein FlgG|nr:flagellar hook-basal body protein [Solirubrobacteraceae bacterium]